jgi:hypothetical protein
MKTAKLLGGILAAMGLEATATTGATQPSKIKQPKRTGWRMASMPEYYGFRKHPIWAENKRGERVQVSVKTCLKKGFKMLTMPKG